MPASDVAGILGTVFGQANEAVRQKSEEQKKDRDKEIDWYYHVMLDPNTPPQKAEQASQEIAKLQNVKFPKGQNPFETVTGLLNVFRKKKAEGGQKSTLPPLNTGVLPSGQDVAARKQSEHTNEISQYKKDLKEANPSMTDEQLDRAVETKFGAIPKTTTGHTFTKKGTIYGNEIPEGEKDINGNPINKEKPYDVLQNAQGEKEYVPSQQVSTDVDTESTDPAGQTTHTHTRRKRGLPPLNGNKPEGRKSLPPISSNVGKLDSQGHIPASSGTNPQIRTIANQLLDGQDVAKIKGPSKDLLAGQALAEKYGWSQGKFTPKEQTMLAEATDIVDKGIKGEELKVLDGLGFTGRMKLGQLMRNPDKEGFIGRGAMAVAAQNLTDKEAAFMRLYNQMVGRVSGLAQLTRSGRATEATIERLKKELADVLTAKDSNDARERLKLVRNEVDIAMRKGTFEGGTDNQSNTEKILRKHGVIP